MCIRDRSESVVQIVFAISFGVVMCIAVDLQARHHVEDTDAIKSQMDAAARVADEIIQMSGALSEKFDSAREKADVLTESMVSSNNSVKEIASSVKLTAEAIEQQTMQTNGIQTNIENAEKETKEMQTASDATQDALREGADPVSYTHLDVYKRQELPRSRDLGRGADAVVPDGTGTKVTVQWASRENIAQNSSRIFYNLTVYIMYAKKYMRFSCNSIQIIYNV